MWVYPTTKISIIINPILCVTGDVLGSLEAISNVLGTFYSNICTVDIMKQDVGDVSESDIQLAQTFAGTVVL